MKILERKLAEAGTKAVIFCLFLYLLATLLFTGKQPFDSAQDKPSNAKSVAAGG